MVDEECDFHSPKQCDSGRVTRLEALIHTLLVGFFQIWPKTSKLQLGTSGESMPSETKKQGCYSENNKKEKIKCEVIFSTFFTKLKHEIWKIVLTNSVETFSINILHFHSRFLNEMTTSQFVVLYYISKSIQFCLCTEKNTGYSILCISYFHPLL